MENWKGMIYNGIDYSSKFKVSNLGNVFSEYSKKNIKPQINHNGYYRFVTKVNGKPINFGVHRAVACTFIKNPDNLPQVNHIDGNKLNNNVNNLEWCNNSYNVKHAIKKGLTKKVYGEKNVNSKLTKEKVKYIRTNYIPFDRDFGTRALARKFNVSKTAILYIIQNKTWKD